MKRIEPSESQGNIETIMFQGTRSILISLYKKFLLVFENLQKLKIGNYFVLIFFLKYHSKTII